MSATLNTRASGFAQDFDSELTRAYLLFQVEPLQDAAISRRARGRPLRPVAGAPRGTRG